jgi:CCT motif
LEEKGLIDRQQKGILKDLIICGDEELQQALDQYEAGDPSVLENMIKSGALQNKAVPDLDLLGDLDLDFLTVHDNMIGEDELENSGDGPGMYTLPQNGLRSRSASLMQPPPPRHNSDASHNNKTASSSLVSPEYDDGIGELEFNEDFEGEGGAEVSYYEAHDHAAAPHRQRAASKSRTFSTSIDDADKRLRSNSLFSALINDPRASTEASQELGRWMDRVPPNDHNTSTLVTTDDGPHETPSNAAVSNPIPIPDAAPLEEEEEEDEEEEEEMSSPSPTKKKGRRKSDSAIMDRKLKAQLKQEAAEQKRREKQEKREQREREKQEKREARLAAKEEKKRLKEKKKEEAAAMAMEEDEKPEHVPGSGRPRSMSDPNFVSKRDEFGLVEIERPDGWVGAYSPESRKVRIEKFLAKRHQRVWTKTVKYDVRKNFADSRLRVKGRFVKKEDEMLMRDLMSMT